MCWRCDDDEVYNDPSNNGMCYNCWAECTEAYEENENNTFEDGEI